MFSLVQQWIHTHASVYVPSGSHLFDVCLQEFRKMWLSEEMNAMRMLGFSMDTHSCVSLWRWCFHTFFT